jgi:hypothetical protein
MMQRMLLRRMREFGLCGALFLTACPQWPWDQPARHSFGEPPAETFRIHTFTVNQVMTRAACVSPEFFRTSKVQPILGRSFVDQEFEAAPGVAMLSYDYWQAGFQGRPDLIGKTLRVSDEPHTIVGILPPRFWAKESVAIFLPAGEKSCAGGDGGS